MTAAATQRPEPYEVPEGGLGSFLTATVGDWSDEALNADNYYDVVKPTADQLAQFGRCLLYTSPSPRDGLLSRMPSSA